MPQNDSAATIQQSDSALLLRLAVHDVHCGHFFPFDASSVLFTLKSLITPFLHL
jgi:hypothetical protein